MFLMAFSVLMVLASCGGDDDSDAGGGDGGSESSQAPTKLTAILPSGPALIPLYYQWAVAQEMGYWEDENLDVELIGVGSGSASAMQQLVAGNGDVSQEGPALVFDAVEEGFGEDITIIGNWLYVEGVDLKTYPDSPVQSIEDLAGKKIGISEMAGQEVTLLEAVLAAHGIEGWEFVPIGDGSAQTIKALQDQSVAAYATAGKDFFAIEREVELREVVVPEWEELTANVFTAHTSYLEENRDAVVGYMRGLAKATVFSFANPDATVDITTSVQEADFPPELVKPWIIDWTQPITVPEELVESHEIFAVPDGALEKFLAFYRDAGQIADDVEVDIEGMSDASLIADINDFDFEAVEQQARDYE